MKPLVYTWEGVACHKIWINHQIGFISLWYNYLETIVKRKNIFWNSKYVILEMCSYCNAFMLNILYKTKLTVAVGFHSFFATPSEHGFFHATLHVFIQVDWRAIIEEQIHQQAFIIKPAATTRSLAYFYALHFTWIQDIFLHSVCVVVKHFTRIGRTIFHSTVHKQSRTKVMIYHAKRNN